MLRAVPGKHLSTKIKSLFKVTSENNNIFVKNTYKDGKRDIPVHISNCFILDNILEELLPKEENLIDSKVHFLTNIIGNEVHFSCDESVNWYFAYFSPNETWPFPLKTKEFEQHLEQFQVYTVSSDALKLMLESEAVMGCHLLLISSSVDKDIKNIEIKYVS